MFDVLRHHLLHLLQKDGSARPLALLEQELGLRPDDRWALRQVLDELCSEGRVILGPHQTVKLPALSDEVTGIFKAQAQGYGFVRPQQDGFDEDVFIPAKATAHAMSGDRVQVQIKRKGLKNGPDRITGRIVKILERAHRSVVGILRHERDRWLVQPDGVSFFHPIEIEGVYLTQARPGDKVSVQIRNYASRTAPARGTIQAVLGRTGRYSTEMAAIIRRYQLHDAFESSALVEAAQAKATFEPSDIEGREDLRDALVVTIDPPDAKDFDDAISLTRDKKSRWVLGVHIADVSAFVPADSALDRSARLRGNSVYLPGQTLPMLPEILSNGICSLQPEVPRYTKSVFLTYNKDGQVMATRFCRSVIQSRARLTYEQVDRILKGEPLNQTREVIGLLREMEALARCLQTRRHQAGMLHLAMPETEVILDHEGRAVDVVPKDTSFPHTLIEMFMVEANVAVARLLDRYCIPFMRRIHPAPNLPTLRQLSHTLRLLGVNLSRQPKRVQLQGLLEQLGDTRLTVPVNLLVLRSLAKAVYSPAAVGHYALAASQYCHFTSPIRRYADLIVHRVLDAYLAGQVDKARRLYSIGDLTQIGAHISETEQAAEEAEQEVKTILVLSLLKRCIGEEHEGVVVSLSRFGATIFLPEFGVQGLLRTESLGADQWQFDERHQCLVSRHSRTVVRLAQPMRVRITEVHPAAGRMDLVPAQVVVKRKTPGTRLNIKSSKRKKKPTAHKKR